MEGLTTRSSASCASNITGVGVIMLWGGELMKEERRQMLGRRPHQYIMSHVTFLRGGLALMIGKWRWVVLHYSVYK